MLSILTTVLLAVLIFGFIIFSHELGHYVAARWAGIAIEEFAIGMGPVVYSREDKHGIKYSFRLFPIGGFLAMVGEDEESSHPNAFEKAKAYKRGVVIAAGAVVNLICGYLLLVVLVNMMGYVGTTTVARFAVEGEGSSTVLQAGDEIVRVNGKRVRTSNDIQHHFLRDADGLVTLTVIRDGETVELPAIQFAMEDLGEGVMAIDIDFRLYGEEVTFLSSLSYAFNWGVSLMKQIWGSVYDIATGRYSINQLSGPVGVASAIGQASRASMSSLLIMTAFITINIGIVNLLPLPMLDGGKLILIIIEGVTGFKLHPKVENAINTAGFVALMLLMVFVTFNDIARFFR